MAFHCHPDAGPPGSYFSPYGVEPPNTARSARPQRGRRQPVGTITDGPPGEYITDRLTDEAVRFIETSVHEHAGRPFFLNLWHYGVHGPWGHKESITAKMAKRTDPSGRQDNPVMASMLKSVDESLGRLLDTLDRLGIADNTIVVLMGDNGGNTHSRGGPKMRDGKADSQSASYRTWAGDRPPTNNSPLRDGKGTLYEGGVRVPLIARFPGRITPGTTSDAIVGCTDIYPTVLDLSGIPVDPAQIQDGVSCADVLRGKSVSARESYVMWFPGRAHGAAAYTGDWKLIRREEPAPQGDGATRELYNLEDDLAETRNIATEHPDRVLELEEIIDQLLVDSGAVVPRPNPARRKKIVDEVEAAAQ